VEPLNSQRFTNYVDAFSPANANSLDAAILVTLNPGTYTAQVTSASGSSGFVLIEVYEVP